jgi:hypothetical protein
MKTKLSAILAAVICVGAFAISEAQSAPVSFSFDVNGTGGVFGAPGTSLVLATHSVDSSVIGRSCQVTVDVHNNDSVREGTEIVIASSGASVTAPEVEAQAGDAPPAVLGNLVLGSTVTGSVVFGPEGQASVAATIIIDCPDVPTTTTTTTTTTAPPQVSPAQVSPAQASNVSVAGVVVVSPRFTG